MFSYLESLSNYNRVTAIRSSTFLDAVLRDNLLIITDKTAIEADSIKTVIATQDSRSGIKAHRPDSGQSGDSCQHGSLFLPRRRNISTKACLYSGAGGT